jgi:UDP-N-acetylmuramoyl-L-alanyl-D-glutamate--2,6-diaminopimelate ligase
MSLGVLESKSESRMVTVADLALGIGDLRVLRGGDLPVAKVRVDSRSVGPGDLFVAIPGEREDGIRYARSARERGAVGVVAPPDREPLEDGAWLTAEDVRLAAALLASRAWGDPSSKLDVLAVTGTNGKTTTSFLVHSIWGAAGRSSALVGTLGAYLPGERLPPGRTTPEAPDFQETLARAFAAGATMAVAEVSSHALDLRRVDGTRFAAAAFLNLGAEHLDWHGTLESYGRSKMRLFSELLRSGPAENGPRAILNGNDPWADRFRSVVEDVLVFAMGGDDADVTARGYQTSRDGAAFTLETPAGAFPVELALPGRHNVENALAAASLAHVMGISGEAIVEGLRSAKPPPGRFERVHHGTFDAYVDYAHTEDGLRCALEVAREIARARVILVIGCGGDRDPGKRPEMGRLAAELADLAVFTAANPRGEDPRMILDAMLEGAGSHREHVTVVEDREEALRFATDAACEGDVVLAVGKGHETVQSIGGVDHPFPEREILARLAARRDRDRK